MIKKIVFTLLIFVFCGMELAVAKEPKNLDLVKQKLIRYHDSGEYQQDQAKVIDKAMEYLKTRLQTAKSGMKLAIVLDIDETSLSNYPDMLRMNFGGAPNQIDDAENLGKDPVIAPTLALFRYAKANHVAVFFVTGRREKTREATSANLKAVGFNQWDGLILKPMDYHEKTAAIYKTRARQSIESEGYDIVMTIGDQQSDLGGGFADKTFKMPNPYYLIP